MTKTTLKRLLLWTVALTLAVIMVRTSAQVRKDRPDKDEESEKAAKSPASVSIQNGQPVITLDPEAESRAGVEVASLKTVASREQITAPAVVLSAQELVSLRNTYASVLERLEKARANVDVSQQEFDRLEALYEDNQNASRKALEGEQGTLRSNQAEAKAAQQDLILQRAALRQSWGGVISRWVADDAAALNRVFEQQDLLVQVTMPPSGAVSAPATISLGLPQSRYAQAKLISPFPRVDPRIQGVSFLYAMPNRLGLAPGLTLAAHLAVGRLMHGVLVPQPAVVWWQGRAWAYKQLAPGQFARQEVDTSTEIGDSYFVPTGISTRDKIVMRGAQVLLSTELGRQAQGGEEDTD